MFKSSTPHKILLTLLLFLSTTSSANEMKDNSASNMLIPIILTLTISESEKNNPQLIAATQERVLKSLQNYQVENIQRYRYIPSMALSVEQAGIDFLKTSKDVSSITQDGLSAPNNQQKIQNTKENPCQTKK